MKRPVCGGDFEKVYYEELVLDVDGIYGNSDVEKNPRFDYASIIDLNKTQD